MSFRLLERAGRLLLRTADVMPPGIKSKLSIDSRGGGTRRLHNVRAVYTASYKDSLTPRFLSEQVARKTSEENTRNEPQFCLFCRRCQFIFLLLIFYPYFFPFFKSRVNLSCRVSVSSAAASFVELYIEVRERLSGRTATGA